MLAECNVFVMPRKEANIVIMYVYIIMTWIIFHFDSPNVALRLVETLLDWKFARERFVL